MSRLDTRRCRGRYQLTAQDADDPHGFLYGSKPRRVVIESRNETEFIRKVAEYLRGRKAAA